MANKYNNCTSIRFDEEIKPWLYQKMQAENRSLGNLVNTILKQEKEREDARPKIETIDDIRVYLKDLHA